MAIPQRLVSLIDLLFAWTKPQDWRDGRVPIVWPSNDLLSAKLGISVRQVQKLLNHAQMVGLLGFADSPNGHRGGRRGADGQIVWAYGIVLAPLGTRHGEFSRRAADGAAEDAAITILRKRLAAARRSIRSLAQALMDAKVAERSAGEALALAQMATAQMRNVRDNALLSACVEQIEEQARVLGRLFEDAHHQSAEIGTVNSSCSDAVDATHSTTTTELQSAKANTSNGLAKSSRKIEVALYGQPSSDIEADLDKYGVGPDLIAEVAPELCSIETLRTGSWGEIVANAERLAGQSGISRHAFREACRVMGERGAAVSVITAVEKYRHGDVHRPGAYLRGMTRKATHGELNLGRSVHGLKDLGRLQSMQRLSDGTESMPLGALARQLLFRTRAQS